MAEVGNRSSYSSSLAENTSATLKMASSLREDKRPPLLLDEVLVDYENVTEEDNQKEQEVVTNQAINGEPMEVSVSAVELPTTHRVILRKRGTELSNNPTQV